MDLMNLELSHLCFLDDLDSRVIDNRASLDLLIHDLLQKMERNEIEC